MKSSANEAPQPGNRLIDRFEFVVQATGTLVIRPKACCLDLRGLEQVCARLLESKELHLARVEFDFANVTELQGSWSLYFGLLIRLSREVAPQVSVTGLHGQPAAAAWVYRHSPAMRTLLRAPQPQTGAGYEPVKASA